MITLLQYLYCRNGYKYKKVCLNWHNDRNDASISDIRDMKSLVKTWMMDGWKFSNWSAVAEKLSDPDSAHISLVDFIFKFF